MFTSRAVADAWSGRAYVRHHGYVVKLAVTGSLTPYTLVSLDRQVEVIHAFASMILQLFTLFGKLSRANCAKSRQNGSLANDSSLCLTQAVCNVTPSLILQCRD